MSNQTMTRERRERERGGRKKKQWGRVYKKRLLVIVPLKVKKRCVGRGQVLDLRASESLKSKSDEVGEGGE